VTSSYGRRGFFLWIETGASLAAARRVNSNEDFTLALKKGFKNVSPTGVWVDGAARIEHCYLNKLDARTDDRRPGPNAQLAIAAMLMGKSPASGGSG
jgi:hypothetical protein